MKDRTSARRLGGRGARFLKPALVLALLIGAIVAGNAWAGSGHHHHGHGRASIGFSIGAPLYWPAYRPAYGPSWHGGWPAYGPGWYGDPYYRYGAPLVVQVEPPVYIERGDPPAKPTWYYCGNPQGYYPYVTQCSTDWRPVAPESVIPEVKK
jgi:hypothetical protein